MGGVSNNTIPLTIGKVTNTLSLSSHTHNYIINTGNTTDATLPYSFTGLQLNSVYNGSFPYSYGNVLTLRGTGSAQIFVTWNSTQTADNNNVSQDMWIRGQRDSAGNNWSVWTKMITDKNYAGILDSRYFTETEINNKFANYYTKTESESRYVNVSGDTMTGDLTVTKVIATSNGVGTNFRVGDDAWIGDINVGNTLAISGQTNSDRGYINFSRTPGNVLGCINGQSLTWRGTAISLNGHTHDDRYYTESESDGRFFRGIGNFGSLTDTDTTKRKQNGAWTVAYSGYSRELICMTANGGSCSSVEFLFHYDSGASDFFQVRTSIDSNRFSAWRTVWTTGNFTPGNYYTKTESDSRFINVTGDCMTGNLMIKGSNGLSTSASIHLGIGDSDTGFKWISDGVIQMYANNVAIGQWNSSGMNWYKTPMVNGTAVSLSNHGHSVINTSGRLTCETNFAARNGIRLWEIYSNGYPFSYGNLLEISAINGVGQFACQWHGNEVYYRSAPDTSRVLTAWSRFWTSTNFNPANKLDVSTFNSTIGDINTLLDKINGTVI